MALSNGPRKKTSQKYNIRGRVVASGREIKSFTVPSTQKTLYYTAFLPTNPSETLPLRMDISINETIYTTIRKKIERGELNLGQEIKIYGEFFERKAKNPDGSQKSGFNVLHMANILNNKDFAKQNRTQKHTHLQTTHSPVQEVVVEQSDTVLTSFEENFSVI